MQHSTQYYNIQQHALNPTIRRLPTGLFPMHSLATPSVRFYALLPWNRVHARVGGFTRAAGYTLYCSIRKQSPIYNFAPIRLSFIILKY